MAYKLANLLIFLSYLCGTKNSSFVGCRIYKEKRLIENSGFQWCISSLEPSEESGNMACVFFLSPFCYQYVGYHTEDGRKEQLKLQHFSKNP